MASSSKKIKASRKGRTGSATLKKTASKRRQSAAAREEPAHTVRVGLHGLGELFKEIHRGGHHENFMRHMDSDDLSVTLHPDTAARIRSFARENLPTHLTTRIETCDCDPRTDPYCICFGSKHA